MAPILGQGSKQLNQIPILNVRGTHSMIGYTIGRQFKSMIDDLLTNWGYLSEVVIPKYSTPEGRQIYETSLELCTRKFPGYVAELEGMSEGAQVPFYKLFLLHIDTLIAPMDEDDDDDDCNRCKLGTGCTSILSLSDNGDHVYLAHTEDACAEFLNNVYIIAAEVLDDAGQTLEKFTTLTYAGHLPGYTMGFNQAGLVYSVNTIFPKTTLPKGSPRTFIARALLGASNLDQVLDILRDSGTGISDSFSLNLAFIKEEGPPTLHNIEVGPSQTNALESDMNVQQLKLGECLAHSNILLRLQLPELGGLAMRCSTHRLNFIRDRMKGSDLEEIKRILSDGEDPLYSIYLCPEGSNRIKTVAMGIFDIMNKTWSIYMEPPAKSRPLVIISMN